MAGFWSITFGIGNVNVRSSGSCRSTGQSRRHHHGAAESRRPLVVAGLELTFGPGRAFPGMVENTVKGSRSRPLNSLTMELSTDQPTPF